MLGAVAGDIIGSVYEHRNVKKTRFPLFHPLCRFTDDTVHTVALAESILDGTSYARLLKSYYRAYPHAGYGGMFHQWAQSESEAPYNSFGNGSAMRSWSGSASQEGTGKRLRPQSSWRGIEVSGRRSLSYGRSISKSSVLRQ
jgi:ADP-ribosylglycohydrolase